MHYGGKACQGLLALLLHVFIRRLHPVRQEVRVDILTHRGSDVIIAFLVLT